MQGIRILPLLTLVLLFGTIAGQSTRASQEVDLKTDGVMRPSAEVGSSEALLPVVFPSSHAANLLLLQNGDLLCFWFSGTWEGDSDVSIVMSRLARGTTTWTKTIVVDHQKGKSYQNPVAFQDAKGRVWVFHTSQTANQGQADSQVLVATSDDNGIIWGTPAVQFSQPGSYVRQPLLRLSKAEWLFPMYYTPSKGITKGAESNYSAIKITKDEGKTWTECVIPDSNGLVQPTVVRLSDGSFLGYLRSRYADWIYQTTSKDGCNWTEPKATPLPNNNASIQLARLKNGHLVLAFNNNSAGTTREKPQTSPRKPLSVALSVDEGKSWQWVRDLEVGSSAADNHGHFPERSGREEYSYPAILQGKDEKIYVAYTYRRLAMKVVSFDEDWIKGLSTVGKYKPDSQK
jgi:predicted neuraminidase